MHEEDVLHQCTKGAWLSSSDLPLDPDRESASTSAQPKALVLDLEGADGIERGTDKSLERRLALFAMVVTDTLIINTLASTVGLADGGCVPLLTMVFQVTFLIVSFKFEGLVPFIFNDDYEITVAPFALTINICKSHNLKCALH